VSLSSAFVLIVQPVSAILTLIGLGFRFYSRQSIISAQPVLLLSVFVPTRYASSSSIHPSTSFVARHPFPTVLVPGLLSVWGFLLRPPLQVRFVAFLFCLGVTSPWVVEGPSKTSHFILRLPSRPVSRISLSPIVSQPSSPVIISCQSATVRLRLVFVFVNVSTVSPLSFLFFTRSL
jgi:hypothetical protein